LKLLQYTHPPEQSDSESNVFPDPLDRFGVPSQPRNTFPQARLTKAGASTKLAGYRGKEKAEKGGQERREGRSRQRARRVK